MTEDELLEAKSFRDRVSTVSKDGKRQWVYALKPKGKWTNYRKILATFYIATFFILPFIKVNGLPFLIFDITKSKIIIFSKIFWPHDFFIFAVAMVTFIICIVLFTVVFGRLFCGWICPQTVFMEFIYRPIEWLIEGSPNHQKKLNDSGLTFNKIYKKTLKHVLFFLIAFLISNTFLAYIIGVDGVKALIQKPLSENLGSFISMISFTFIFYAVFAHVRELVCTTICPYGRLQSVMFDKDTMQIAYDYNRGEPRGKFKKNTERALGDCIDCNKCVQVCPTNIDIRDGVQMECVGCTACIDACNEVMDAMHFPKGLIRYASENEIQTGTKFKLNARMKGYIILLIGLVGFMIFLISTRNNIDVFISKVSGQTFIKINNKEIRNMYQMTLINKTKQNMNIEIKPQNFKGKITILGNPNFEIPSDKATDRVIVIDIPNEEMKMHSMYINLQLLSKGKVVQTVKTKFLGPF